MRGFRYHVLSWMLVGGGALLLTAGCQQQGSSASGQVPSYESQRARLERQNDNQMAADEYFKELRELRERYGRPTAYAQGSSIKTGKHGQVPAIAARRNRRYLQDLPADEYFKELERLHKRFKREDIPPSEWGEYMSPCPPGTEGHWCNRLQMLDLKQLDESTEMSASRYFKERQKLMDKLRSIQKKNQ